MYLYNVAVHGYYVCEFYMVIQLIFKLDMHMNLYKRRVMCASYHFFYFGAVKTCVQVPSVLSG